MTMTCTKARESWILPLKPQAVATSSSDRPARSRSLAARARISITSRLGGAAGGGLVGANKVESTEGNNACQIFESYVGREILVNV